jgi:hypothetical protein
MKPMTQVSSLFGAIVFTVAMAGGAEPSVTLESLLEEMIDPAALARWPQPAFVCKQASSYDRATKDKADQANWFANKDYGQFIRVETNGTRREWVIMEQNGPGALVRFWLPLDPSKDNQVIRFYLDGSATPAIETKFNELLSGRGPVPPPFAFVAWNETVLRNQMAAAPKTLRHVAGDLYLPIPFARGCKITLDQLPFYYVIDYRAYAPGTPVESFSTEHLAAVKPRLDRIASALLAEPSVSGKIGSKRETIAPGEELALELPRGPAAVRRIEIRLDPRDAPQILRSASVTATFDGQQTAWCPLGEFFGAGARLNAVRDRFRSVTTNGVLTAYWVMPYQRQGRLGLKNLGQKAVQLEVAADTSPWSWDDRSMYFYANWRYERDLKTRPMSDWNYITIQGRGQYAGDTLTVFSPVKAWYGEGDEKIYVDGETFPSHIGTGTEDYYGYAWGMATFFSSPFISAPRRDFEARDDWRGFTTTSRMRLLDSIPFHKSLQLDMEIWNWADTKVDYAVGTFWYAAPGAGHNRPPQPRDAGLSLPLLPEPVRIAGAVECETMKILAHSEGLKIGRQQNIHLANGDWNGDAQLFVQATKPGDFVELLLAEKETGPRKIVVYGTKSYDYGILRFTVNGQPAGKEFDGYAAQSALSGPQALGRFDPREGRFVLRIEVVGAHPASKGPKYYFGLDCVVLE